MPDTPITLTAGGAAVTNTSPTVSVTVGGTPPSVGSVLTFSLLVVDDLGNKSTPATCTVTVRGVPAATLTGPPAVAANTPITLVGTGTPQGGGKIVSFVWQLTSVSKPS